MNPTHTISFRRTGDAFIPAYVSANGYETPVWLQGLWPDTEHAYYIRHNGCGHCCAAMAARLHGVPDIDPLIEYGRCLALWGEPDDSHDHFITARGITEALASFGVPSEACGVPADAAGLAALRRRIDRTLREGRQVIFWSHPKPRPDGSGTDNPFSTGEHYVMAVGYAADGRILIANSGNRVTSDGAQLCDLNTVMDCLFAGCTAQLTGWGIGKRLPECGGIVFV